MVTLLSVGLVWPSISSLVESAEVFVWSVGTTQRDATASSARTDIRETTANRSATARPAIVSNNWFVCVFYAEIMFKLVYTWVNHSCRSTSEKKNMFFFGFAICGVWGVWKAALSVSMLWLHYEWWNAHWYLPFDCSHIYGMLIEHFSPNMSQYNISFHWMLVHPFHTSMFICNLVCKMYTKSKLCLENTIKSLLTPKYLN